jgi:hypothetical protein
VRVTNGAETFTGTTAGLAPEGLLLVKRDAGEITAVIAGDVEEVKGNGVRKQGTLRDSVD